MEFGDVVTFSPQTLARLDKILPPWWNPGNPVDMVAGNREGRLFNAVRITALIAIGKIRPQSAYHLFLKAQKDEKEYSLRLLAATGHGLGKPGMNTIIRFLNSERIKKSAKED